MNDTSKHTVFHIEEICERSPIKEELREWECLMQHGLLWRACNGKVSIYEEIWQKMLNFEIKINQSHATYVTIQFSC